MIYICNFLWKLFVIILFIDNINDINSDIKYYSAFRILILTMKEKIRLQNEIIFE